MKGYYHPRTDTYTPIEESEKIVFPIRFNNVPISRRKELKQKLLSCIETHPSVVFMHPNHRRQGIRYILTGTSVIEPEFMKNMLATNFVGNDSIILIIGTATISVEQNHESFTFHGFFENKTPFTTRRRVCLIDSVLQDI